ncbi:hypothetical protein DFH11DRAFT_1539090 [Phellopilus nigrolimitatus]|nr:hypothetical protein DFH11DRAFT_1539090 [Phellopilus nigrolimitatus]
MRRRRRPAWKTTSTVVNSTAGRAAASAFRAEIPRVRAMRLATVGRVAAAGIVSYRNAPGVYSSLQKVDPLSILRPTHKPSQIKQDFYKQQNSRSSADSTESESENALFAEFVNQSRFTRRIIRVLCPVTIYFGCQEKPSDLKLASPRRPWCSRWLRHEWHNQDTTKTCRRAFKLPPVGSAFSFAQARCSANAISRRDAGGKRIGDLLSWPNPFPLDPFMWLRVTKRARAQLKRYSPWLQLAYLWRTSAPDRRKRVLSGQWRSAGHVSYQPGVQNLARFVLRGAAARGLARSLCFGRDLGGLSVPPLVTGQSSSWPSSGMRHGYDDAVLDEAPSLLIVGGCFFSAWPT